MVKWFLNLGQGELSAALYPPGRVLGAPVTISSEIHTLGLSPTLISFLPLSRGLELDLICYTSCS